MDRSWLAQLIDDDTTFYADYAQRERPKLLRLLESSGEDIVLREEALSSLLSRLTGEYEAAVCHAITQATGIADATPETRRQLRTANDLKFVARPTAKIPDFFVVETRAAAGEAQAEDWTLLVAIELKLKDTTWINGGFGYCPTGQHVASEEGEWAYSNQVICYANNCWIAEPDGRASRHRPQYLWLAPDRLLDWFKGLGSSGPHRGLNPQGLVGREPAHPSAAALQRAAEWQEQARELWTPMSLESLVHDTIRAVDLRRTRRGESGGVEQLIEAAFGCWIDGSRHP